MAKITKDNLEKSVRILLTITVILIMIRQIMLKEWEFVFLCIFTLIMFSIPSIIDKRYKVRLPIGIELSIYAISFCTAILGEIQEYYLKVSGWDKLMHFSCGMGLAAIFVFILTVVDKESKILNISIFYKAIFVFCFTITVLVFWEFFEFAADNVLGKDMQKDVIVDKITSVTLNEDRRNKPVKVKIDSLKINEEDWIKKYGGYLDIGLYDTMYDLFLGALGAATYSIGSYFYLKKKTIVN